MTIVIPERDFDRLFRCSSHRMLTTGRGELRALFEHSGSLYAVLSADEALPESARAKHVRSGEAMRVALADDYPGESAPFQPGKLTPERLQGMIVQHQGIRYVLADDGVTFTTERTPPPKLRRQSVFTTPSEPGIPQGIPADGKGTVSPSSRSSEIPPSAQTQIPPLDVSFCTLPLDQIVRSANNPREVFDEEGEAGLQELGVSIKENGLIQPITVRPIASNDGIRRYEIIAGERRFRASKLAGMETIDCLIRQADEEQARLLAVVENLQRKGLNPFEQLRGFEFLLDLGWSQSQIAEKVGCKQPQISRVLGLTRLPEPVQEILRRGDLSPSHGQRLLSYVDFPDVCTALAQAAVEKRWTVKELEAPLGWDVVQVLSGPNSKKLAKEFSRWDTAFDYKAICVEACPFKAYRSVSSDSGICLKPAHYNELQRIAKRAISEEKNGAAAAATAFQQMRSFEVQQGRVAVIGELAAVASQKAHGLEGQTPPSSPSDPLPATAAAPVPVPEPAPKPSLPTIPHLSALRDCVPLAEGDLRAGQWIGECGNSVTRRPPGCSPDCECAGAAKRKDGSVIQICTSPKRLQKLQETAANALLQERRNQASRRREKARTVIADTRADGIAVWEPQRALLCSVHHLLRDQLLQGYVPEGSLAVLGESYGVELGEGTINAHSGSESFTALGWDVLREECSIPTLFLILAEMRTLKDAEILAKGWNGSGPELTAELLALESPRAGMTLTAATGNTRDETEEIEEDSECD